MRYAIVSDIHANLRAWNSVLADLREHRADVVVCLGDVVGYGPKPAEVLKAVRSVTTNFVMGNHDAAAVGMIDYSIFNSHARQAIEWTMTELDPEAKQFLSSVPLTIESGDILFVHAEISEPGRFDYISDTFIAKENFKANKHLVTFVGHTHYPKIFERSKKGNVTELPDNDTFLNPDKRYIVNVGSVGEPRNPDDLRARYVIYDSETKNVIFRRVEFDIASYRTDLAATSLTLSPFFLQVYEHISEGREVAVTGGGNLVDMRVSHNSASLVDLGKVIGVGDLSNSITLLKSAQPRRAPVTVIVITAILTLITLGFWLLSSHNNTIPPTTIAKTQPEPKPVEKTTPRKEEKTVVQKIETPKPITEPKSNANANVKAKPTPSEIAKIPDQPKEIAKTKPDLKPEPKPDLKTIPKLPKSKPNHPPIAKVPAKPAEVIWWRMGDGDGEGDGKNEDSLVDKKGQISLIPITNGRTIKALAPNPIPWNQAANSAAKQLGIWQEEKSKNHFALTPDHSFTFEGWFFISNFRKPVFLFGTRSSDDDGRGWHLDLRPLGRTQRGQSMSFFYDSGENQTQAIAENLKLTDSKAHHFAIVWDHDEKPDQGNMKVYLDGEEVASNPLPHEKITGKQFHPFRIGANFNRAKIGLDELRFTRKSLQPSEFLMLVPIEDVILVKSDGRVTDSWSITENWEGGQVPSGLQNAVIGPGLKVQISKSAPLPFSGSLVLKEKSSLYLWSKQSESVIQNTKGTLVMYKDSKLILRSEESTKLGRIKLAESAEIFGGISSSGHGTTRTFASEISGSGEFFLTGVNNNTFIFEADNTFTGGLTTKFQSNHQFKVIAAANGCLGKGPVNIGEHASLQIQIDLTDTISDTSSLILKGPKGKLATKLILDSDETVKQFIIDDIDQGKGEFTKTTHPKVISGNGTLTVE